MTTSADTPREMALLISGASGMVLPLRLAELAVTAGGLDRLHLVVTKPAERVLTEEVGADRASARKIRDHLLASTDAAAEISCWSNEDLGAPIASGSRPLAGTVVLPCSSGTAGAVANGISRGLVQRAADVALKQRWPLILGIREAPMSPILLENLHRLSLAGATIMPPMPAFYLNPDPAEAFDRFIDHFCLRILDLLGVYVDRPELRWRT